MRRLIKLFLLAVVFISMCLPAFAQPTPSPDKLPDKFPGLPISELKVGNTGAGTYSLPIVVPPGTARMAPRLALVYNAQMQNGLLGMGWSVTGLSAIHRCPATIAQDSFRGGINYDSNDRFCLDGQRLMAITGAYGADGTEYRTEIDSFVKVISSGVAGNGPASFKVWNKDGTVMEFGETQDSRIEAQSKASVRIWALNKI